MTLIEVPGNFWFHPSYHNPDRVRLEWGNGNSMVISCPPLGPAAMVTGWVSHGKGVYLSLPGDVVITSLPRKEV